MTLLHTFAWQRECRSTRRKLAISVLGILALLFFSFLDLQAQTTNSGELTGVVSDPSDAVVPAAVVELRSNTKGTLQTAKTDDEGVYRFFFLAPGRYTLTVSHDGFATAARITVCRLINRSSRLQHFLLLSAMI
jgi:hypothetical protein